MLVGSGSITSCQDDDIDDVPSLPEEGVCKPGDDFYTYANAEWLQSLEGKDPNGKYNWFKSIGEVNDVKLEDIKKEMPQYQAINSSLAKLETNYEASVAVVNQILAELEKIETREQAYEAFGKLIGMGIPTVVDAVSLGAAETDPPLMVTPREVDLLIARGSRLLACAIHAALQPAYSPAQLSAIAGDI